MSLQQKVSSAIRILRWNRDVSARASHLVEVIHNFQAGSGNVSGSTVFFERKLMSTKTSIKRIAAVAAVALTLGGFSAVSANATATNTFSLGGGTAATAATASVVTSNYESVTLTFVGETSKVVSLTSTGVGTLAVPSIAALGSALATTGVSGSGATLFGAGGTTDVPGTANNVQLNTFSLNFSAYSATAGTQTISVTGAAGTSTATITWGAAPTYSATYSTAVLLSTTSADTATTDSTIVVDKASSVIAGEIKVTVNNNSAAAYNGATVSATIAGSGLIAVDTSTTQALGSVRAATSGALVGNVAYVHISGDSTAGTGTVTVTVTDKAGVSSVLATKTVTFTGSAAKVSATANLKVLKAGGTTYTGPISAADATTIATTSAVTGLVTDANGNPTTGNVKIVSSDSTVLTAGLCVLANSASAATGEYNCQVNGTALAASGKTATITFELSTDSGATYAVAAAPLTFTIGGSIAKEVLSTDATSYLPLAPIKVIVTATDSSGNPAYDQDAALVGTPVSSILLGGALASPTKILGGVGSKTGAYAPAAEYSSVTISGTDATSAAAAISTTFDVTAGAATVAAQAAIDAAQEATDAANAAYDAANNAMDSADAATAAAQDASDNASAALAAVTSLSATVAKLVSSVTAIATALASIKKKLGVK